MKPNLLYNLALTYIPGIGPVNQRKIMSLVEPEFLWSLSIREKKEIFRNRKDILPYLQSTECLDLAQKELEYCEQNGIEVLLHSSEAYPEKLKNCPDSPLVLFKKGNYDFHRHLYLGIIGTRKITSYGKRFIEKMVSEIASHKIVVVSGLAYGCDIEAHRSSLRYGVTNIAVLAHGLNRISPVAHKKEALELQANGALLTEYSTFHNAEPINFVLRNRIIAGICDAVIVVESDIKGGAMATAQYANAYNREVFALPGRVDDKFSLGCNYLIQSNQAYMIRDAEDLFNYYNLKARPQPVQKKLFTELNAEQQLVYESLSKKGKQHLDQLAFDLQIPLFKLNSILLEMEMKQMVKVFLGKYYDVN